jgi:hypothetical protein
MEYLTKKSNTRKKAQWSVAIGILTISALGLFYYRSDMTLGVIWCLFLGAVLIYHYIAIRKAYKCIDLAREKIDDYIVEQKISMAQVVEQIQQANSPLTTELQMQLIEIIEGLNQLMLKTPFSEDGGKSRHTYSTLIDCSAIFRKKVFEQNIELYFKYSEELWLFINYAASAHAMREKSKTSDDTTVSEEHSRNAREWQDKMMKLSFSPKILPHC